MWIVCLDHVQYGDCSFETLNGWPAFSLQFFDTNIASLTLVVPSGVLDNEVSSLALEGFHCQYVWNWYWWDIVHCLQDILSVGERPLCCGGCLCDKANRWETCHHTCMLVFIKWNQVEFIKGLTCLNALGWIYVNYIRWTHLVLLHCLESGESWLQPFWHKKFLLKKSASVCCLWWIQVWESVLLEGEFVEPYGKPDKPFHRGAHLLPFPISVFLTTGESTGGSVQSGRGSRGAHEYLCQNYWTDVCAFWQPLQYRVITIPGMLSHNYLIV